MKLSVCIPVYNFDIRELVYSLHKQISEQNLPAEIIIIDDASDNEFKTLNSEIQNITSQFIQLEKNIGRSKIRNLFLQFSKGEYLLFLDCDAQIIADDFLKIYLKTIQENPNLEVIYGSFRVLPQFSKTLRNRYSVAREIFLEESSKDFSVFKTVNFVIKKSVFETFNFNENLNKYGYEDYLFSQLLEDKKIRFTAIQNPVFHYDNTSNQVFLEKIKISLQSLLQLSKDRNTLSYIQKTKIYKTASFIKQFRLTKPFLAIFSLLEKKIEENLLSEHPSIQLLDVYKLGHFLRLK